jgi:histidinol dehydrogenase
MKADTIDAIKLESYRNHPEWFRELGEQETVYVGDIAVEKGIAKYCSGPFHTTPTVKDMRRITRSQDLRYYREYPNG